MQKDISHKKLEEYNDVFADIFNALLFDGKSMLSEEFLDALSAVAGDSRYEAIKTQIQNREETEVVTMCVLAEKLEKRGMEKGIEKGIFVMITDYEEDGKTKQQILGKLELRFQLSQETAEHYYNVYLNAR